MTGLQKLSLPTPSSPYGDKKTSSETIKVRSAYDGPNICIFRHSFNFLDLFEITDTKKHVDYHRTYETTVFLTRAGYITEVSTKGPVRKDHTFAYMNVKMENVIVGAETDRRDWILFHLAEGFIENIKDAYFKMNDDNTTGKEFTKHPWPDKSIEIFSELATPHIEADSMFRFF